MFHVPRRRWAGKIEPTHSDFFWYAIHGAEPLFTVAEEPGMDVWSRWPDGTPRIAVKADGGGYAVFMGLYDYQPAMLRRLAKLAGVKLLISDDEVGKVHVWSRGNHVLRQSVETGDVEMK